MTTKHRGKWVALGLTLWLLCLRPGDGLAQNGDIPFDPRINVQLFEYSLGPKDFFSVDNGEVAWARQYSLDFMMTFLTSPFVVFDVDQFNNEIVGTRTDVVDSLLAGQIGGAYGITDNLHVGAFLPLIFTMHGQGVDPNTGQMSTDNLQAAGVGNLRLEVKHRFWEKNRVRLAWIGGVSVPTNLGAGGSDHQGGRDFFGDGTPDVRGRIVAQWTDPSQRFTAAANGGAIFRRPRTIYSSRVGQQLTYGAGAAYQVHDRVAFIGELFGHTGMTDLALQASPLEAGGGLRFNATKSVNVVMGAGAGLIQGIGAPGFRAFFSLGYAPDFRDQDGDGIPNIYDECPLEPEDYDGFEDEDGCPDPDNDGDMRMDWEDACPNDPEDFDGFEDQDGCPELDNDSDGIPDAEDKCPNRPEDGMPPFPNDGCPANARDSDDDGIMDDQDVCPLEPEDFDGFEDEDGCPDPDNDGDGIPDIEDQCPNCAEDFDGFQDEDGCPDLDNDGDGIPDSEDKCPNEPETINGYQDFDGCPDSGGQRLVHMDGDRLILDAQIQFDRRGRLTSVAEVDQVAALMRKHTFTPGGAPTSEVTRWRIVVANPRGRDEARARTQSQQQADTIKARIVHRGVSADAIEAIGTVADSGLIAFVVLERRSGDEEFICPAGFEATPNPRRHERRSPPSGEAASEGEEAPKDASADEAKEAESEPAAPKEKRKRKK